MSQALTSSPVVSSAANTTYIPALDGCRAIAVGLVVASHIGQLYAPDQHTSELISHLGGQGVAIFFAISGFLITTLLLNEASQSGRISFRSFYIRRVFRILPPAFTYLAVIVAVAMAGLILLQRC